MSSNCSLVTGPGMSSSSICAESCGRAALPLAAAVLNLRGMKTPLVECYASHTKFLTGSEMRTFIRPSHLALLGHAPTDNLIDRLLSNRAADGKPLVMATSVVHQILRIRSKVPEC